MTRLRKPVYHSYFTETCSHNAQAMTIQAERLRPSDGARLLSFCGPPRELSGLREENLSADAGRGVCGPLSRLCGRLDERMPSVLRALLCCESDLRVASALAFRVFTAMGLQPALPDIWLSAMLPPVLSFAGLDGGPFLGVTAPKLAT